MGVQDRDWWRDAQRQKDRDRANLVRELAKASASSAPKMSLALRWGHVGILAFWFAVMGVVYLGMDHYLKPKPLVITAQGDLKIPRHRDGHFYVKGSVNSKPLTFLVDTGASSVTVSEEFARSAGLQGGEPTTFNTANGQLRGRLLRGVAVSAGPFSVSTATVGVGLVGGRTDHGLLGQSFLSRFQISISKEELVLRRP
jgi:aspartyl protease family protein